MRLFYLAGVAILTFAAGGTKVPQVYDLCQDDSSTTSVVSAARFLRATRIVNSRTEERAGGISVSGTEKLAKFFKSSKVTDEQLQKWVSKGKTAENVFYRMDLENIRFTRLFKSPTFLRWLDYADDLSASGKGTPAISVLSAKYGDDKLYRMIGWAQMEESTKALGTRLKTDQLKHWVKIRKDPDEVFKLYDLEHAGSRILGKPKFSEWAKYVDDLNAKNEGVVASIIPTLRKFYSDDDLFHIALAAKRVDETEPMGTKLEDAFVQFWIHRKETPDNVLLELGLKKSTETLLENTLLNILTKYTEAYNAKYSGQKTTVIETFTQAFGDEKVARMLIVGRGKPSTKEIATKFHVDQLEMWMNSGQSVDDVYKLLGLPSPRSLIIGFGGDKIFDTWLAYMNAVSVKNPEKTSAIFSTLAPTFKDRPMMQILEAANKFPSMQKAATKLQLEKAGAIFSTGVSPYEVFSLVALDYVGDSILSSPLFKKFMNYAEGFSKKNLEDTEPWFLPLRANYPDYSLDKIIDKGMKDPSTMKLAQLVEKERMEEWLVKWKYPPSVAFRDLHLNKAGEKVFSSPKFKLWVKYLDDWNQAYPGEKATMIDGFRANYHDLDLIPMLTAVEKVPNTKKLASQLKDALTDKWVAEKKTLDYVKSWISHVPSSDEMLERYTKKLNSVENSNLQ